jgi:hypothetical protein
MIGLVIGRVDRLQKPVHVLAARQVKATVNDGFNYLRTWKTYKIRLDTSKQLCFPNERRAATPGQPALAGGERGGERQTEARKDQ